MRGDFLFAATVFLTPAPWLIYQMVVPSARAIASPVRRFKTAGREVWLTIDDGPNAQTTREMLALLARHEARATFFAIGSRVALRPDLAAEIVSHGHTLANHTATHPCWSFWCAGPSRTRAEIDEAARAFTQAGIAASPWFRPPAGIKNVFLHPQLASRGLDLVLWSARGLDGAGRRPAEALARIKTDLAPGSIILVHENPDHPDASLQLLEQLLTHLAREGYRCVIPARESFLRC